jgi:hypothetical protein
MDFQVSSKQQQRGILTGMLLGRSFRNQGNFVVHHQNPDADYLAWKRSLLTHITGQTVDYRQWQTRQGQTIVQLHPKQIPLSRVLVQRLYQGDRQVIRPQFLRGLTLPGVALWFMERGARRYKRQDGQIRAVELCLNTLTSKSESDAIADYFREQWDVHWGLSRFHQKYRLRLGTQAGQRFFEQLKPYLHPNLQPLLNPSNNRTATT